MSKPEPEGVHQVAPVAAEWVCPWGICNHQQAQDCRNTRGRTRLSRGCGTYFPPGLTLEQAQAMIAPLPAQPATPALQAGSPEPLCEAIIAMKHPFHGGTDWARGYNEGFSSAKGRAIDVICALAAPAVGAPGDALSVGVPPPPMSDADLWAAVCTGLGWGSPPIVQSTTSRLSFQAARAAVDARDAQWLARAGGVRAAATLGGTGGSGEAG